MLQLEYAIHQHCSYAILGFETAPTTNTFHIQAYVNFNTRKRFSSVKTSLNCNRIHVEPARGDQTSNFVYCSKSGNYFEFGTRGPDRSAASANHTSRDQVSKHFVECISNHGRDGIDIFARDHPGVFYFSAKTLLESYALSKPAKSRPNILVYWLYGPPGIGKSRIAHKLLPNPYYKESRTKWWHGYLHESTCIIDDLCPKSIDINYLLKWFDRYPCYVETKGSTIALSVETFIVTSNFSPEQTYSDAPPVSIRALNRRIKLYEISSDSDILRFTTIANCRHSLLADNSERWRTNANTLRRGARSRSLGERPPILQDVERPSIAVGPFPQHG